MNKLLSLMFCLAAMFALTACGNDDEPENGVSKDRIIGLWDATAVQVDGRWVDITNRPDLALSISFYENSHYISEGALGDGEGTYAIKGNTIETYIDGQLIGVYTIKELRDDYAELSLSMGGEGINIKAKKSKLQFIANDPSIIAYHGDANGDKEWVYDRREGNKLYRRTLQVTEAGVMAENETYTLYDSQTGFANVIIETEGKEYHATIDSRTPLEFYAYSFDGKTLVLRDDRKKSEKVYSASVRGDNLTISDGTTTETYIRVSLKRY